ncbi:MAG: (2Fe-2S)-binding protein [Mangrovicoccus sp.]|nr:(2Fe-2S)-binding protein [Mangrovicoccus sp.]
MIICHCQTITDRDIDAAIDWMRAADPDVVITPGRIYRALGKSADCGGCLPLFLGQMRVNPQFPVPAMDSPAPSDQESTRRALHPRMTPRKRKG